MSEPVGFAEPCHVRRNGPVHGWFELSYSSYLVLPRLMLSQMPTEWQDRFVACLEELRDTFGHYHERGMDNYTVTLRGERGRIIADPLSDYRRGPELSHRTKASEART